MAEIQVAPQLCLASTKFFKLPDFWVATPNAWFGIIKSQLRLRGVDNEADRFSLVT